MLCIYVHTLIFTQHTHTIQAMQWTNESIHRQSHGQPQIWYIHIYIYAYTYIHICIYIYIHSYIFTQQTHTIQATQWTKDSTYRQPYGQPQWRVRVDSSLTISSPRTRCLSPSLTCGLPFIPNGIYIYTYIVVRVHRFLPENLFSTNAMSIGLAHLWTTFFNFPRYMCMGWLQLVGSLKL